MDKVFSNKKFAFALIGVLLSLQLTQSIANWCGGGFNGGSLILCILMLGLLVLVGVGIAKKNKLLTIVSGVSILSVVIYALVSQYSGLIQDWNKKTIPLEALIGSIFAAAGTLLLVSCLVLAILKTFKPNKDFRTINIVFCLIAFIFFLVKTLIPLFSGAFSDPNFDTWYPFYSFSRDFFALFMTLLIPCVWHQVDAKE